MTDESYAGSFWIFGHGGCGYGGDGSPASRPASAAPSTSARNTSSYPVSKRVMVTGKLRALVPAGAQFTVRVVPYVRPDSAERLPANLVTDLLQFDRADLITYQ